MENIADIRNKIDLLDDEIAVLLCERMNEVEKIAALKKYDGFQIRDVKRENEIIDRISTDIPKEQSAALKEIYEKIFEVSRSYQAALNGGDRQ